MVDHYIAWWNLENLFETSTFSGRSERLQRRLGRELTGWTKTVLARKISQLASIVRKMNGGLGPDILGVCEVENEAVLQRLVEALFLEHRLAVGSSAVALIALALFLLIFVPRYRNLQ